MLTPGFFVGYNPGMFAGKSIIPILSTLLALSGLLVLAACGGVGLEQPTPAPLPTSILPGLVTVQPWMCRLAELSMLRVDEPQGDLLAWAPGAETLAYVAPASGSTWLVGALVLVDAPAFDTHREIASQAAGDLAWSPAGSRLAYLSLRRGDTLFSVNVTLPQAGTAVDLFPAEAARTDAWSSQKAVLGWADENRLQVQVSCGLDCMQALEINLVTGGQTPLGEQTQRAWDWWDTSLNQPVELPEEYQEFMQRPNWSPDGRQLVYLDQRLDAWVVSPGNRTQFILDTGGFLAVGETDWSYDGQYLAVQAEDRLFIFGTECP